MMPHTPRLIPIRRSVPIPNKGRPKMYPWLVMELGDSFEFPKHVTYPDKLAYNAGRRYGRKFSVRKVNGSFFCWRVL